MYETYWGLKPRLAGESLDPTGFYRGASHLEALARLHFLVEQHCRLGLVYGDWGAGKSYLLAVAAAEFRKPGCVVTRLAAGGLGPDDLVCQLAQAWSLNPDADWSTARLWQAIGDRAAEWHYQRREVVLLLDDLDEADLSLMAYVARLIALAQTIGLQLTVIASAHAHHLGALGRRLLELIELRVELLPWDLADTHGFVQATLARGGRQAPAFEPAAVERLYDLTLGNPRRVQHLVHLSLAAGAGQRLKLVDEHTVETVVAELGIPAPSPLPA
ncbi:MAG: AAA family ATPase [Planctomycetes bacterium]|nr:AAA family ATPase [Planctomycetota bacterium]